MYNRRPYTYNNLAYQGNNIQRGNYYYQKALTTRDNNPFTNKINKTDGDTSEMSETKGPMPNTSVVIDNSLFNNVLFGIYHIVGVLGEGKCGRVYKVKQNNQFYALKIEKRDKKIDHPYLEHESNLMNYLRGPNIPSVINYVSNSQYLGLVMEILGFNLKQYMIKYKKFSVKTTAMIGYQMVNALQYIHDRHIIHRDIKPDNILMGLGSKSGYAYLIDFGFAKKYRSSQNLNINKRIKKAFVGNYKFGSIPALENYEQSRRDDLESLGYVLAYFLRGNLPWDKYGISYGTEDDCKAILNIKKSISGREMCQGFPDEFAAFIEITRKLTYEEDPNYDLLRKLLRDVVEKKVGSRMDFIYDWTDQNDLAQRENMNVILNNTAPFIHKKNAACCTIF